MDVAANARGTRNCERSAAVASLLLRAASSSPRVPSFLVSARVAIDWHLLLVDTSCSTLGPLLIMATPYPSTHDYVPLSDYQSSTPDNFDPKVLHAHHSPCKVLLPHSDLAALHVFGSLATLAESAQTNGHAADEAEESKTAVCSSVEVFVNSHDLLLANKSSSGEPKLLRIPYQAISIHATQRVYATTSSLVPYSANKPSDDAPEVPAILLYVDAQYDSREQSNEDEDNMTPDSTLTLVPSAAAGEPNDALVEQLFEALSDCADLPRNSSGDAEDEDESGSMPLLDVTGGSGWITADNADEFEDVEAGAPHSLGEGAGTRRVREDGGGEENMEDDDDTKWQRTG